MSIDLEADRFGSAGFADCAMRKRAGLYRRQGAYIGHDAAGRACYAGGQSAILLCGGARSLKGSVVMPWLVDGYLRDGDRLQHIIALDLKRQDTVVASLQVRQGRHGFYYNPRQAAGMPSHRMNPCEHFTPNSATLVADALLFAQNWIPNTDPRAAYFEGMAQKLVTAAIVTETRETGFVTLPTLADRMAGLGGLSEAWLSFEHAISCQPEPQINEVAGQLQELRAKDSDSGGWAGIKNEIARSFSPIMDAQIRAALSAPFDLSFQRLTEDDCPPCMVSIMEDLEFAETTAPVIRAIFTAALIAKRRAPMTARPQFWCLNEIAHFPWPMAESLSTISAGFGIRTAYVVQSSRQLDNLKKGASTVIPQSCGVHIYLGTRSVEQASLISRQLGRTTLAYDDTAAQERARAAGSKAMLDAMMGGDPFAAALEVAHQDRLAQHKSKMARDLRSPDEVLNTDMGQAYVFMPGVLEKPFLARIPPYWQRRDLAGAYLGDPFHSKPGTVEIATRWGQRHRTVITEAAPRHLRDWPQYRDSGLWSYVKGYRP
ncbi:MAG: type IV secretory system conjugative DNA transfer family protein [Pseudomonadota bacterium]